MNLYLAGPMRGHHLYGLHKFASASWDLREMGHRVFNPIERDLALGPNPLEPHIPLEDQEFSLIRAMTADLAYIASAGCDAVAVMDGWEKSTGALLEVRVAQVCGKEVFFFHPLDGLIPIEPTIDVTYGVDIPPEGARIHP